LLGERALHGYYADGEEAVLVLEGAVGAVVDVDGSVGGKAVEEPELAVSDGDGGGEETRV
jgi:hypothetical protein